MLFGQIFGSPKEGLGEHRKKKRNRAAKLTSGLVPQHVHFYFLV